MAGGPTGVFLTDFGLAKNVATGSKYTRSGVTLGTPAYMSPEQARGDLADCGPPTDVWSLGCLLYVALTESLPFDGLTPAEVIMHVVSTEPPPLASRSAGVPRAVSQLVAGCLAKTPADRYADGRTLAAQCDRVLAGRRPAVVGRRRRPVRRWAALATVVAATGLTGWAMGRGSTDPPPARSAAAEAEALAAGAWALRHGNLPEATARLRRALQLQPDRHAWRLQLGLLRWAAGDDHGAEGEFRCVPDDAPQSGRAWWLRGLVAYSRGIRTQNRDDFAAGVAAWGRAVAAGGREADWARAGRALHAGADADARALLAGADHWEPALLRGQLEYDFGRRRGDPAAALAAYDIVVTRGLPLAWVHINRGILRKWAGDRSGARADFDRAIRLQPTFAKGWANRGTLRREFGDDAGAAADLDEAIRLDPTLAFAWLARARLNCHRGRRRAAWHDVDQAIAVRPRYSDAWFQRALMYVEDGDDREALRQFDRAAALDPDDPVTYYNRASARKRLRDFAGALRDYDRAIAHHPGYAQAYVNRGLLRRKLGQEEGALADFEAAVRADPELRQGHVNRARWLQRHERYPEALEAWNTALAVDATYAPAWRARGITRKKLGDLPGAVADLTQALTLAPDDPNTLRLRGRTYTAMGRPADGLPDLLQALAVAPADWSYRAWAERDLAECRRALGKR